MSNFYKQTAIEFAKQAYSGIKFITIAMSVMALCVSFWYYIVGWSLFASTNAGMATYLSIGVLWIMISTAMDRARLKEEFPDLD